MKKAEIKRLEDELGRYRKKVSDQERQIAALRNKLTLADQGSRETQIIVDAILAAVAVKYGEAAEDPDESGKILGKRLVLPLIDVCDMQMRYEVHARRDETALEYIVGVVERQE